MENRHRKRDSEVDEKPEVPVELVEDAPDDFLGKLPLELWSLIFTPIAQEFPDFALHLRLVCRTWRDRLNLIFDKLITTPTCRRSCCTASSEQRSTHKKMFAHVLSFEAAKMGSNSLLDATFCDGAPPLFSELSLVALKYGHEAVFQRLRSWCPRELDDAKEVAYYATRSGSSELFERHALEFYREDKAAHAPHLNAMLRAAAESGSCAVFRAAWLVYRTAALRSPSDAEMESALFSAASGGSVEIFEYVFNRVESWSEMSAAERSQKIFDPALICAAAEGRLTMSRFIRENGASEEVLARAVGVALARCHFDLFFELANASRNFSIDPGQYIVREITLERALARGRLDLLARGLRRWPAEIGILRNPLRFKLETFQNRLLTDARLAHFLVDDFAAQDDYFYLPSAKQHFRRTFDLFTNGTFPEASGSTSSTNARLKFSETSRSIVVRLVEKEPVEKVSAAFFAELERHSAFNGIFVPYELFIFAVYQFAPILARAEALSVIFVIQRYVRLLVDQKNTCGELSRLFRSYFDHEDVDVAWHETDFGVDDGLNFEDRGLWNRWIIADGRYLNPFAHQLPLLLRFSKTVRVYFDTLLKSKIDVRLRDEIGVAVEWKEPCRASVAPPNIPWLCAIVDALSKRIPVAREFREALLHQSMKYLSPRMHAWRIAQWSELRRTTEEPRLTTLYHSLLREAGGLGCNFPVAHLGTGLGALRAVVSGMVFACENPTTPADAPWLPAQLAAEIAERTSMTNAGRRKMLWWAVDYALKNELFDKLVEQVAGHPQLVKDSFFARSELQKSDR